MDTPAETGPLTEQEFRELAEYNGALGVRGDAPTDEALRARMAELQERWNRHYYNDDGSAKPTHPALGK